MTEKKYVLPVPEAIEFLETSLRELEERACYRFRDIEKRLADLESDECSRCGLVIKKEDYIASRENSTTFEGPENGLCVMRNGKLVTLDKDSLEKELVSALNTILVLQEKLLKWR